MFLPCIWKPDLTCVGVPGNEVAPANLLCASLLSASRSVAKITTYLVGMVAVLGAAQTLLAQSPRPQFPTPYPADGSLPGGSSSAAATPTNPIPSPGSGWVSPPPAGTPAAAPGVYSPPPTGVTPNPSIGPGPVSAPSSVPGPAPIVPGPVPGPSSGSAATFQGGIQPPPTWDPYGTPNPSTAPLFPQDPFLRPGAAMGTMPPMTTLLQKIRLENNELSAIGSTPFGMSSTDLSATFAFPLFGNVQTPLLVTPGIAVHFLDGPLSVPNSQGGIPDLPPRLYDTYLDGAWNPQFTPQLGSELSVRIGLYSSDYADLITHSIRIQGCGLAVLTYSPSFQIKAGVDYLDRNEVKILPDGGVVWTPDNDSRFEFLFPNPKLARRLTTIGTADWWYYARGEYGGGAWTVTRTSGANPTHGLRRHSGGSRVAV